MKPITTIFSLSFFLLLLATSASAGKLYKWVAEDGSIYYSDKVPPTAITGAHSQLNSSGIEVEAKGAARTAAEIAQEKQKEFLRKQQEELLKKQNLKDTTLLKTFRSVDDMVLARDGKLATYDTQIKLTHENIANLKARLLTLQERAAQSERQGKAIGKKLLTKINNTDTEIRDNYASILRREKDKELIFKKYNGDIKRFSELKHLRQENINEANITAGKNINATDFSLVDTAVLCTDKQQCDNYWQAARAYGKKYATTATQLDAANIYISKPPETTTDISVTVSRVKPTRTGKEVIFLDIKCRATISGIKLCNSERLKQARKNFKSSVAKASK